MIPSFKITNLSDVRSSKLVSGKDKTLHKAQSQSHVKWPYEKLMRNRSKQWEDKCMPGCGSWSTWKRTGKPHRHLLDTLTTGPTLRDAPWREGGKGQREHWEDHWSSLLDTWVSISVLHYYACVCDTPISQHAHTHSMSTYYIKFMDLYERYFRLQKTPNFL